jgi:hypothetical protein
MIQVAVRYNDNNDELYCTYSKERIQIGEKFAYLIIEAYEGEVEKIPYKLENLPAEEDYNEDLDEELG